MKQAARLGTPSFLAMLLIVLVLAAMAAPQATAIEGLVGRVDANSQLPAREVDQSGPWLYPATAPMATVEITATDTGWYNNAGDHPDPHNRNYSVGNFDGIYVRNFLVFDLSGISRPIVSATLSASNPASGFYSADPSEIWTLFDVTTPITELREGGTGLTEIYEDLGSGVSCGNVTVNSASNGTLVDVPLNSAGLATLNAARGGSLALGGALTSLDSDPMSDEFLFSLTHQAGLVQKLTIVLAPVQIAKTAYPILVDPGSPLTYTLTFSNDGGAVATNVWITDTLPVTLTNPSFAYSGATVTPVGGATYIWQVEDLSPGKEGVITVTGVVDPQVSNGTVFTNTAAIASSLGGNQSGAAVQVPFRVTATQPVANDPAVSPDTSVSVTFNGPVNTATVDATTFHVWGSQTGRYAGSYAFPGAKRAQFDHTALFKPGEQVATVVNSGIQSNNGTSLIPTVWQFWAAATGGSGHFTDSRNVGPADEATYALTLGDVDSDDDVDLVVGNEGRNRIYLNDSDGTFDTIFHRVGPGDDTTMSLALGDVDGDGDLDLALGNYGGRNVVYLNDGDGTFDTTSHSVGPGSDETLSLVPGDVDGDGDLDLAVGNYVGQNVVYLNDGDGTFDTTSYNVGPNDDATYILALGDVDSDGDLDLVVGNDGDQNTVYLNDGDGTFDTTLYNVGPGNDATRSLVLGDVDGDGDLDLAVGNQGGQNTVHLNDGDGTFDTTSHNVGPGNDATRSLVLGDMDGDGDLDLAVGNRGGQNTVHLNDGDGTFETTSYTVGPSDDATYALAMGDVDGDGDLDLAVGNYGGQNIVSINQDPANLALAKTVAPPIAGPGQAVTYTIVYTNLGPKAAITVRITDVVPITLTSVSFNATGAPVMHIAGTRYAWQVADLAPGSGGVITISGTVNPSASGIFSLTNQATITAAVADVNRNNNTSVVSHVVDAVAPLAPTLVSPTTGTAVSDTTPTLIWKASPSPDVAGYLLDWNGTVTDVGDGTQATVTTPVDGVYTWTVAAYDGVRNTSPYTDVWSFSVDTTPPDPPMLVSPAAGAVVSDTTPTLIWKASPSPDVAGYLLDWNGTVMDVGDGTQTTVTTSADGVYTWTVAAYDGVHNTSPYTDTWPLTVEARPPRIVSTAPPGGATGVLPCAPVMVTFSEPISPSTFAYTISPDPGGWAVAWSDGGVLVRLDHNPFEYHTTYTVTVTAAEDLVGKPLSSAPVAWCFTTSLHQAYLPLVMRGSH